MCRVVVVVVVVVLLAVPALAQAQTGAVGTLAALEPHLRAGAPIVVTSRDGTEVRGRVRDISGEALELSIGESVRRYAEADVALVERRQTDNLLNGTLIGAGVGAGAALAMYLLICAYEDCSDAGEVFAVYGAIGGAIGLAVDASVRPLRPIYIAGLSGPASRPRWSVAPVLARRGGGAALSLSF